MSRYPQCLSENLKLFYGKLKFPLMIQSQPCNCNRSSYLMNKSRTLLELFFAIWFVMGNVWVFDSRHGTFSQAPNLHILCISLLAWNAITYSFPFLLFVLLCCCVPLISNLLGYNMNMGSVHRGATDDQISQLPKWRFKDISDGPECNLAHGKENLVSFPFCFSFPKPSLL